MWDRVVRSGRGGKTDSSTEISQRPRWLAWLALPALLLLGAGPALAQANLSLITPPVVVAKDPLDVDLISGMPRIPTPGVSVGDPAHGGLSYAVSVGPDTASSNMFGAVVTRERWPAFPGSATNITVYLFGAAEEFSGGGSGSLPYAKTRSGSTLVTQTDGTLKYTTGDGTVAIYGGGESIPDGTGGYRRIESVTRPNGEVITYHYRPGLPCPSGGRMDAWIELCNLSSITNNRGYQLKFTGTSVIAINNAVDYCDPGPTTCSIGTWPTVTYARGNPFSTHAIQVTGPNNKVTTINVNFGPLPGFPNSNVMLSMSLSLPGSTTPDRVYTFGANPPGNPMFPTLSVQAGSITRNYAFSWSDAIQGQAPTDNGRYATVTAGATQRSYEFRGTYEDYLTPPSQGDPPTAYPVLGGLKLTKEYEWPVLGGSALTTTYDYETDGILKKVTHPEGNYTEYTYDARGNVKQVMQVPKTGTTRIYVNADFPATCTDTTRKVCNQPTWIRSQSFTANAGPQTDFTYDSAHGGALTVTAPAPTPGAVRPQVRTTFQSLSAYFKNSSGTIVAAPSPVYLATASSQCATSASCTGGADEVKSTTSYGATGVANNLLPVSTGSGNGSGTLTATIDYTYDNLGNVLTVDGPLTGAADTVRKRYDALRRVVGETGPDPDGGGALKHRALRRNFNDRGELTSVETGTVNSQSDGDWAAFAVLQKEETIYDAAGRKERTLFISGGSTQSVVQYSYDSASRLDCTAVRMNPAAFASLPASACAPGTSGANGSDRITRNGYDAADRLTSITSAYATSLQQVTKTITYSSNGRELTLADAKGNKTTYVYDGFDRLWQTQFPNPFNGPSSNPSDYEQLTYDAASNVTQLRRRDGNTVSYGYDALNRKTVDIDNVGYSYDNLGRKLTATRIGETIAFEWDALGRLKSETTGSMRVVASQYDLAGRRTRITWPDNFYVDYNYDLTGALTHVRENGATSGAGVLAAFTYDNLGRRTNLTRGNGVSTTYSYDAASRLETLAHSIGGTSHSVNFTRNIPGQILTKVANTTAFAPPAKASGTINYTANGLNQMTAAGGNTMTYDARGNLWYDQANYYYYDIANRLTSGGGASLTYDAAGRLDWVHGNTSTQLLYDGVNLIGEYDENGYLIGRYVHGSGVDEPLVWFQNDPSTGIWTWHRRTLVADNQGSIIAVTNASGASTAINTYDEYGAPGPTNLGRFQYTGQTWIAEAGLYHYKARAYSPYTGRFLQTDPTLYADGMNLYAYVGNDPLNATDPSGEQKELSAVGACIANPFACAVVAVTSGTLVCVATPACREIITISPGWMPPGLRSDEGGDESAGRPSGDLPIREGGTVVRPGRTGSRDEIIHKPGGETEANEDFDGIVDPDTIQDRGQGVRTGTTSSGARVTVRPGAKSDDGRPTVDVTRGNGKSRDTDKFRYGDKDPIDDPTRK